MLPPEPPPEVVAPEPPVLLFPLLLLLQAANNIDPQKTLNKALMVAILTVAPRFGTKVG